LNLLDGISVECRRLKHHGVIAGDQRFKVVSAVFVAGKLALEACGGTGERDLDTRDGGAGRIVNEAVDNAPFESLCGGEGGDGKQQEQDNNCGLTECVLHSLPPPRTATTGSPKAPGGVATLTSPECER